MYTYRRLTEDLAGLRGRGAVTGSIGKTVLGIDIPFVHLGTRTGPQVLFHAAIHAREHITSALIIELIYYTAEVYRDLFGGIYFIPMVNIDGVNLCEGGAGTVNDPERRAFLLAVNGAHGDDFSLWKANANAVDLNCNFAARWGTGAGNLCAPAPESFIGPFANSEPETRALIAFTLRVRPALTVSYHCKGAEIYWQFHQCGRRLARDRRIAERFARETCYAPVEGDRGSAGGYKDWCVQELGIPAFTFETVDDRYCHPVDYSALREEFPRNRNIPITALEIAAESGQCAY
jgi:g-D-glutamyl-meso-diaminopimelate peptidase